MSGADRLQTMAADGLAISVEDLIDDVLYSEVVAKEHACGCWGMQLTGHLCTPFFAPTGTAHFKNKFCPICREDGVMIAADRVCLVTPALQGTFTNKSGPTFWRNNARLVNQMAKCSGAAVVIFKGQVPAETMAVGAAAPEAWHRRDASGVAYIKFVIAWGTLVPAELLARHQDEIDHGSNKRSRPAGPCSDSSSVHDSEQQGALSNSGGESPPVREQPAAIDRVALLDAHEHMVGLITAQLRLSAMAQGGTGVPGLTPAETDALERLLEPLQHSAAVLRGPMPTPSAETTRMESATSSTAWHAPWPLGMDSADASLSWPPLGMDSADASLSWPPSPPVSSRAPSRPTTAAPEAAPLEAMGTLARGRSTSTQTNSSAAAATPRASICGWVLVFVALGSLVASFFSTPVWLLLGGDRLQQRGQAMLLWLLHILLFHTSVIVAISITLRCRCLSAPMAHTLSRRWLYLRWMPCLPTRRTKQSYRVGVQDITPEMVHDEDVERPMSLSAPSLRVRVQRSLLAVIFMVVVPTAGTIFTGGLLTSAAVVVTYPAFQLSSNITEEDGRFKGLRRVRSDVLKAVCVP